MVDPVSIAAGSKALSKIGDSPELPPDIEKFLEGVSGGARREVGAWIGDHFRYRRMKAQLKLLEKATEHLRRAGRDPREVKWSVLFPLLEAGSLEEDDEMSDRWAALLASAADPAAAEVPPSFPEVLKQLSSDDARILDFIVRAGLNAPAALDANYLAQVGPIKDPDRIRMSIENLLRVRILREETYDPASERPFRPEAFNTQPRSRVRQGLQVRRKMTLFGQAFATACKIGSA